MDLDVMIKRNSWQSCAQTGNVTNPVLKTKDK